MNIININSNTRAKDKTYVHEHNEDSKKYIYCVNNDTVYKGVNLCARELDIDSNNLRHCLSGKRKKVKGYMFRYLTQEEIDRLEREYV